MQYINIKTDWARLLGTTYLCLWLAVAFIFSSCENAEEFKTADPLPSGEYRKQPFALVLGIAQDAGYPQAGCMKDCCKMAWMFPEKRRLVCSIGVIDPVDRKGWIIDATPDFPMQQHILENTLTDNKIDLAGIFLTHAHIGHYTGLMHLGREVMGAQNMPVYAMPSMRSYLESNGPWSQLVSLKNIELRNLYTDSAVILNERIKITPMTVPHRDEFSETVGFKIEGVEKSLLFIPDIDKWHLWERDIRKEVADVDYAMLDATFYKNGEIPGRDMSEIPHPFVEETMALFRDQPEIEKKKIHFIHFNHTNPVLLENSEAKNSVLKNGFRVCEEGNVFEL